MLRRELLKGWTSPVLVGALTSYIGRTQEGSTGGTNDDEDSNDGAGETNLVYDPYADVDWETVDHHKCEFHAHTRDEREPADVIDLYYDLGYTLYNGSAQIPDVSDTPYYPWESLDELEDDWEETRDPEAMGVVTFPVVELTDVEHVNALFSTVSTGDLEYDDFEEAVEAITTADEHHYPGDGGLAVLAHPGRYYDDPDEDWDRYRDVFADVSREDGFLGIEALNKQWYTDKSDRWDDVRLLDALLSELAPDRMIWGFAVDDPVEYVEGVDYDVRWTTVLLDPDDYDPSSQESSQEAAIEAFREGATLYHERVQWVEDDDDPADIPTVYAIDVDQTAGTISIDASGYDDLEWIADGDVVESGDTVALADVDGSYVRAQLRTADAASETLTQAWGLG